MTEEGYGKLEIRHGVTPKGQRALVPSRTLVPSAHTQVAPPGQNTLANGRSSFSQLGLHHPPTGVILLGARIPGSHCG